MMKNLILFLGTLLTVLFLSSCSTPNAEEYIFEGIKLTKEQKHEEALELFNKAIEINPSLAVAWKHRGRTKFNLGDAQGAITDFTEAIKLDTMYAEAYYNRGNVYIFLADVPTACRDFNKARALNYPNIEDTEKMCRPYGE